MSEVKAQYLVPSPQRRRLIRRGQRFLKGLRAGMTIRRASEAAGVSSKSFYRLRRAMPEFGRQWDDALEAGVQLLEETATDMALNGSVPLLIFLLKSKRPEVYRDIQSGAAVSVDATVSVEVVWDKTFELGRGE